MANEPLRDSLPRTHDALVRHMRQYRGELGKLAASGIRLLPRSAFVVERDPCAEHNTAGVYTATIEYGSGRNLEDDVYWDHADIQRIGLHVAACQLRYLAERRGQMIGEVEYLEQYAEDGTYYDYDPYLVDRNAPDSALANQTNRTAGISVVRGWITDCLHPSPARRLTEGKLPAFTPTHKKQTSNITCALSGNMA